MNSFFKKINFGLHLDPKIEKRLDGGKYIPDAKETVLIIYADFELGWAWRYAKNEHGGVEKAAEQGLKERNNMPVILDLCSEHNIPITWATIGHLFLESCSRNEGKAHEGIRRAEYFENKFWKYSNGDWFDADPCTDYKTNPEWYCPDLIKKIMESGVEHEFGCHTFSHIDCTDRFCPPDVFDSEIAECKNAASSFGIELKSFVHPAHTIGNLDGLIKNGFTSYRTDYNNILGYPEKYKNSLWQLKSTWEFVLFKEWSRQYHVYRYCEIIRRAIKSRTVCVLWFHPSMDIRFFETIFPDVCKYINDNRDKIWMTTATGYVNFLEGRGL
ncbi:MAG TPA: polysaccharide deacetylase family protein [Ignavibacteria bacterium]|nr:polysaccharide deacetylase family protein [Ignavibacteria bacterium]